MSRKLQNNRDLPSPFQMALLYTAGYTPVRKKQGPTASSNPAGAAPSSARAVCACVRTCVPACVFGETTGRGHSMKWRSQLLYLLLVLLGNL